jgi:hypothetical protein
MKETLYDCIRELGRIIEIIEKPFEPELLVEILEDASASQRVQELDATAKTTYDYKNLDSQIDKLLHRLGTIQRRKQKNFRRSASVKHSLRIRSFE